MKTPTLDPFLAYQNPELVILDVLQQILAAAHEALAIPHPEILARGSLPPHAADCHFAVLIAFELDELSSLIDQYRATFETTVRDRDDDDLLPNDDFP